MDTIEVNNVVVEQVAATVEALIERVERRNIITTTAVTTSNSYRRSRSQSSDAFPMNSGTSLLDISAILSSMDSPLPAPLPTPVSCYQADPTPQTITRNTPSSAPPSASVRANNNNSTLNSADSDTSTSRIPQPSRAAGTSDHYTAQDDRVIWRAGLEASLNSHSSDFVDQLQLHLEGSHTADSIVKRSQKLIALREEADEAVRDGTTLVPNTPLLHLWREYCARAPTAEHNSLSIDPSIVKQLASAYGVSCADLHETLQSIRTVQWLLDLSGVHEEMSDIGSDTKTGPSVTSVRIGMHTHSGTSASSICASAAALSLQERESSPRFCSTPAPPTTLLALPVALATAGHFSLHDDGNIWRAYLEHKQTASSDTTFAWLRPVSDLMGFPLELVRTRLAELEQLHLGLSARQHSHNRPFTAAEDAMINAEMRSEPIYTNSNISNNSNSNGNNYSRLVNLAMRLQCNVEAVSMRHGQLKILQRLEEARRHVQGIALAAQQQAHFTQRPASYSLPLPTTSEVSLGTSTTLGKRIQTHTFINGKRRKVAKISEGKEVE